MDGNITILVQGRKANADLSPGNFDIAEIRRIFESAEGMLFPGERKSRPLISYEMQEGSVRHVFRTSLQAIIGFNAVLGQIGIRGGLDFLEAPTARAIESLQENAIRSNYTISISTSLPESASLTVSPDTNYRRTETPWVDGEFYLYGEVIDMGGKTKANVHVLVPGHRPFTIETPREFLRSYESNPLYKPMGVHVAGKQNPLTGEIDSAGLRFIEFIEHDTRVDDGYLDALIKKATPMWADVKDPDEWLRELRGVSN